MDDSRCNFHRIGAKVDGVGRHAVQRLMTSDAIVEIKVAGQPPVRFGNRAIGVQIHLFVLDAAPQPLDEDVGVSSQLRRLATIRADVSG